METNEKSDEKRHQKDEKGDQGIKDSDQARVDSLYSQDNGYWPEAP